MLLHLIVFYLRQDFSLSQELTNSARLADLQVPEICSSLPPLCWNYRCGLPRVTYTGARDFKLRSSCLYSKHFTESAFSPVSGGCKHQETVKLCIHHSCWLCVCVRQPLHLILAKRPRVIDRLCKPAVKGGQLGEASRKDPFCCEASPIISSVFMSNSVRATRRGVKWLILG